MSKLSKIKIKYVAYFKYYLYLISFLLAAFYSNVSLSNSFLECIDDIPISIEFRENIEECFIFDSDTGKISLAEANTLMQPNNIITYYVGILPSFGWEVKDLSKEESFIILNRDQDILKISIKSLKNNSFAISFNFLSLIK